MQRTRRQWMKMVGAGVAAGFASGEISRQLGDLVKAGSVVAAEPEAASGKDPAAAEIPIVDTHQHLWDLARLKLRWVAGSDKLNRNFTLADYIEAIQGLPIKKAVYLEVAVDDDQLDEEASIVHELCAAGTGPTVAAVIGGRPASPEFPDYIRRWAKSPYVKGVRQLLPGSTPDLWDQPEFIRGIQLLGELGLRFELCMPPTKLDLAERLVSRCPQTKFVLDHCGNADPLAFVSKTRIRQLALDRPPQHSAYEWRKGIEQLASHPNVVCKISGIVSRLPAGRWTVNDLAPIVDNCLEVFGEDRVMFGSDWPVCLLGATLREWVEALQQIVAHRPESLRRKLFYENAVRFYALSTG